MGLHPLIYVAFDEVAVRSRMRQVQQNRCHQDLSYHWRPRGIEAATMLRQAKAHDVLAAAGPPLPTLPKAPLPLDELTQLQRRLAHLLTSLAELQDHVANAVGLEEWPWLLSRHLALISQTHSLSLVLSRANSSALHAQLARFEETVLEDARQNNKFSAGGGDAAAGTADGQGTYGGDALFGGKADSGPSEVASTSKLKLPAVQYSDGDANPLRRLAPHPFSSIDAGRSQTVIPSLLLPRGIDNSVAEQTEERWEAWLREHAHELGVAASADTTSEVLAKIASATSPAKKPQWLQLAREQILEHDKFARQALVSFVHAREATDELGQRYDWRLRLDMDEDSDAEEAPNDEREDEKADDSAAALRNDEAMEVDALGMPLSSASAGDSSKREAPSDGRQTDKKPRNTVQHQDLDLKSVTAFLQHGTI